VTDFLETLAYFGPAALVAMLTSALIGVALKLGGATLGRISPAAQSRLMLAAAIAPAFFAALFFWGAASDWLAHGPREFCANRVRSGDLSVLLAGCTLAMAVRAAVGAARLASNVFRMHCFTRAWRRTGSEEREGTTVLPLDEPQAFVMGIFRPRVFLSRGLLGVADAALIEPLLAHERSHVRRRDPLRRFAASIALLLHLPGVAVAVEQFLARAQELAADAEAVASIGDAPRVAESLVWFARLRLRTAVSAFEFAGIDVATRVPQILEPPAQRDAPSLAAILGCIASFAALAILSQHQLHYISELLLRLP
jgi:Zn-dependent protease with chaperone function